MDNGWVKLYRSMTSCKTASRGLNFFGAMAWLVVKANYEESWYNGDKIGRGQLFVGLKYLSKEWKVGIQSVRTILLNLNADGFLTSKSTNKGTILTICNYDTYQMVDADIQQANQQTGNKRVTSNQQTGNNFQEEKNIKHTTRDAREEGQLCITKYPDSVDDVLTICAKLNISWTQQEAQAYFDYRTTREWMVQIGKTVVPMKPERVLNDIRSWDRGNRERATRNANGGRVPEQTNKQPETQDMPLYKGRLE